MKCSLDLFLARLSFHTIKYPTTTPISRNQQYHLKTPSSNHQQELSQPTKPPFKSQKHQILKNHPNAESNQSSNISNSCTHFKTTIPSQGPKLEITKLHTPITQITEKDQSYKHNNSRKSDTERLIRYH